MLVDEKGEPKGELHVGEPKSIQTDRVVLVPGPPEEVEMVRRVYRLFLDERRTEREIARLLNEEGVRTDRDRAWTRGKVHELLTNEKYVGQNVLNRVSFKLKKQRVQEKAHRRGQLTATDEPRGATLCLLPHGIPRDLIG